MSVKYKKTSWCVLRSSERLRSIIEYRIKQRDLTSTDVSKLSGVPKDRVTKYRRNYPYHMSQSELIKVALCLGIEVDLDIKFTD